MERAYLEKCPPYRHEIKMLKAGTFDARLLEKIIEELDTGMRRQFDEKFREIRAEFDKVFKELFGYNRS